LQALGVVLSGKSTGNFRPDPVESPRAVIAATTSSWRMAGSRRFRWSGFRACWPLRLPNAATGGW